MNDLQFNVANLPDAHSHFRGNYSFDSTGKDDVIEYDRTTINGIISLEASTKTTSSTIAKQVFLIFEKTLHELAHASIFGSGRLMIQLMASTHYHMNKKSC